MSIAVATVLMYLSYSSLLLGLSDDSTAADRTAAIGLGLAIVPFVFVSLAFGSRHRRAPAAVLGSMGVWMAVSLTFGLVSLALGISIGFGAAGIIGLRRDEPHSVVARLWGLLAGLAYTMVLTLLSPALGLFAAGTVPLIALGFADRIAETRR